MWVWSLGWEDPLEKEMATHFSILAWRIPRTGAPGSLQSMGSQRDGHDQAYMAPQPGAHGQNLEAEVYIISADCVQLTNLKT